MDEIVRLNISLIILIIQFSGVLLIAVLFSCLRSSITSKSLNYWTTCWFALVLALSFLIVAFTIGVFVIPFYTLYLGWEYVFGYLLFAGCRHYSSDKEITSKSKYLLIPAAIISWLLPQVISDFNDIFIIHAFILACFFGASFLTLQKTEKGNERNLGWRIMSVALFLLTVNFFHYSVAFSLRDTYFKYMSQIGYFTFNSFYDLVLEILLGFGMVIVLLEKIRRDISETNDKLREAHDRLEKVANIDPLTTAFNRHAFYSFLQKHHGETLHGCVGVFDIDNLKPINDKFGHHAGDLAINAVSGAIRKLIRADDLLFRWGGDEFFVILVGCTEDQARERMKPLNDKLKKVSLKNYSEDVSIGVSVGFAGFSEIDKLENAVSLADAEMYKSKQAKKKKAQTNFPQDNLLQISNADLSEMVR